MTERHDGHLPVRVWIDITNSPHVLFFAPIIRRLEEQGHTVTLTARKYAQTEQLLARYGLVAAITGQHAGKSVPAKALGLFNRSTHLIAQARKAGFHVAVGHNSNDLAVAAWTLGIPQLTMFDYEYAQVSHHLNVRLVDEVVVPDAIPLSRLAPYGATPDKVFRYPGLKEEYYLYDFDPDPTVLEQLEIGPAARGRRAAPAAARDALPPRREPALRRGRGRARGQAQRRPW